VGANTDPSKTAGAIAGKVREGLKVGRCKFEPVETRVESASFIKFEPVETRVESASFIKFEPVETRVESASFIKFESVETRVESASFIHRWKQ